MKACRGFVHVPLLVMVAIVSLMVPVSKYVVSNKGSVPGIFNIDGRVGLDRETQKKIDESNKKESAREITQRIQEKFNKKQAERIEAEQKGEEEKEELDSGQQASADRWQGLADLWQGNYDGAMNDSLSDEFVADRKKYLENVGGEEIPMGNGGDGGVSGGDVGNGSSGGSGEGKGCPAKGIVIGDGETAFGPRTSNDRYSIYECDDGVWIICPDCKEVTYGPEYLIDVYYEYEGIEVEEDEEVYEGDEWGVFGEGYGEYWRDYGGGVGTSISGGLGEVGNNLVVSESNDWIKDWVEATNACMDKAPGSNEIEAERYMNSCMNQVNSDYPLVNIHPDNKEDRMVAECLAGAIAMNPAFGGFDVMRYGNIAGALPSICNPGSDNQCNHDGLMNSYGAGTIGLQDGDAIVLTGLNGWTGNEYVVPENGEGEIKDPGHIMVVVGNPIKMTAGDNSDYLVQVCDFNYQQSGDGDCRVMTLPIAPNDEFDYYVVRPVGGSS